MSENPVSEAVVPQRNLTDSKLPPRAYSEE